MNITNSSEVSVWEKEKLGGWDERIFAVLSSNNKKAYALAARLHHKVFRKDGQAYLVHINRSLLFLETHKDFLPEWVNRELITLYIILHDCIEDHPDWLQMIWKYFGDQVLLSVLWMSAPKIKVLTQLDVFLWRSGTEANDSQYQLFSSLSRIIDKNNPEESETIEELQKLLPDGKWISLWENGFQKRYESDTNLEKQKNVFADWIFQWMVYNMPKWEFLAKSFERLDNLTDITGLQDEKWIASYQKTIFTTKKTYLVRLEALEIDPLIRAMEVALDMSNPYIQKITQETKLVANSISSTEGE